MHDNGLLSKVTQISISDESCLLFKLSHLTLFNSLIPDVWAADEHTPAVAAGHKQGAVAGRMSRSYANDDDDDVAGAARTRLYCKADGVAGHYTAYKVDNLEQ